MDNTTPLFIPIAKIDEKRHEVWGWGAIEEPDVSDEIMDYASSKPLFKEWSQRAAKRSGGKSLGNVRAMHQPIAAGKLIDMRADDTRKGFFIGAQITDANEWEKVEAGVYTGFSVGGHYVKRWMDYQNPGKTRYTAQPTEISIVDSPCIKSATFDVVKMDGGTEVRTFQPGQAGALLKLDHIEDDDADKEEGPIELTPEEEKEIPGDETAPAEEATKMEGGDTLKKLEFIKEQLVGFINTVDDLIKAEIPGAPAPLAAIQLPSEIGPDFETQHIPEQNQAMPIEPGKEPSQEALAGTTVNAKDLTAAMEAWLPKVSKAAEEGVAKALLSQAVHTTSEPAAQMIKVSMADKPPKLIKVRKE